MRTRPVRQFSFVLFAAVFALPFSASAAEPSTPVQWNLEGTQLFETGRYREAETLLLRAIEAWSAAPADQQSALEAALHNLAAVYRMEGRFTEAIALYERAVKLRTDRAGATDLGLTLPLHGLALLYLDAGNLPRSKDLLNRAAAIAQLHREEHTSEAANSFAALGSIFAAQRRYGPAREWLVRAVRIFEQSPGAAKYPATLTSLGGALLKQGHRDDAERVYTQAIAAARASGNPSDTAAALSGLAELRTAERRFPEAYSLLDEARSVLEMSPQSRQEDRGKMIARMGEIRVLQGCKEDALELYRQALAVLEPAIGPENPRLLNILDAYAQTLRSVREYASAARIDMRTTKIRVTQALRIH